MVPRRTRTPAAPPEASHFASLQVCDNLPNQCIAHTQKPDKPQCTIKIADEDIDQALDFRHQAESLPLGSERDDNIAQFILLHCCTKWHRDKLERDDTGCWDELIKIYGADIPVTETVPANPVEGGAVLVRNAIVTTAGEATPRPAPGSSTSDEAIPTTPGLKSPTRSPARSRKDLEYFVPYTPSQDDSIHEELLRKIPWYYRDIGELYSFTCPDYAGFVKIGFGGTAASRLRSWQRCDVGASLSKSVTVSYPQRIERLIHLQLAQHRFKVPRCKAADCHKTHIEWFKLSTDRVNQVISDWAELTARAPLYGADGELEAEWIDRIKSLSGDITARRLLDILDTETASSFAQELTLVADEFGWNDNDDTVVDDLMQRLEGMSLSLKLLSDKLRPATVSPETSNAGSSREALKLVDNGSTVTTASIPQIVPVATPQTQKQQDNLLELFGELAIQVTQHMEKVERQSRQ